MLREEASNPWPKHDVKYLTPALLFIMYLQNNYKVYIRNGAGQAHQKPEPNSGQNLKTRSCPELDTYTTNKNPLIGVFGAGRLF